MLGRMRITIRIGDLAKDIVIKLDDCLVPTWNGTVEDCSAYTSEI